MNESDLLMLSLPPGTPVLQPIGRYYNSSPLNYIDAGTYVYDLASGGNSSDKLGRNRVLKQYCAGCARASSRRHSSQICESSYHIRKISVLKISS